MLRRFVICVFFGAGIWHLPALAQPTEIDGLIHQLEDPDQRIRVRTMMALSLKGLDALPALIEALENPDKMIRIQAVSALGILGPAAKPALIDALKSKDSFVRIYVMNILAKMGPQARDAVPAITVALNDQEEGVRRTARVALRLIEPDAAPPLAEALESGDETVRQGAIGSLTQLGPDRVPALISALESNDEEAQATAAIVLGRFGAHASEAIPALLARLRDKTASEMVRGATASALGEMGSDALPSLTVIIKDPDMDEQGRVMAVLALRRIGPDAAAVVVGKLNDPSDAVRHSSAISLKEIFPALTEQMRARSLDVRGFAPNGKGMIAPEALVFLTDALLVDDERIIQEAALALTVVVAPSTSVPILVTALEHQGLEQRRLAAAIALEKMGPDAKEAISSLATRLEDEDEKTIVRFASARALSSIGMDAVPALIRIFSDSGKAPRLRGFLARVIATLGADAKAAIPSLRKVRDDWTEHGIVRSAAAAALTKIQGSIP